MQMTASHLPYTRNGLKFFTKKGGLTSAEVEAICEKAARKYANRLTKVSTVLRALPSKVEFMSAYAKHLRDIIKQRVNHPTHYDTPLQGFQVRYASYIIFLFVCMGMHAQPHPPYLNFLCIICWTLFLTIQHCEPLSFFSRQPSIRVSSFQIGTILVCRSTFWLITLGTEIKEF